MNKYTMGARGSRTNEGAVGKVPRNYYSVGSIAEGEKWRRERLNSGFRLEHQLHAELNLPRRSRRAGNQPRR